MVDGLKDKTLSVSKFLGKNKWLTGDKLTFVDFWLYEVLVWLTTYQKDFLKSYPNLQDLKKRFEEIPSIKKYINQPNYIKGPCINPLAKKLY